MFKKKKKKKSPLPVDKDKNRQRGSPAVRRGRPVDEWRGIVSGRVTSFYLHRRRVKAPVDRHTDRRTDGQTDRQRDSDTEPG